MLPVTFTMVLATKRAAASVVAEQNHGKERQPHQRSASRQRAAPEAAVVRSGLGGRHPPQTPGTSKIAAPPAFTS